MDGDVVLVAAERAYLCGRCARIGDTISGAALAFLRGLGTRTPADVVDRGAPAGVLRDLERAHARLIALHLEKTLRSARVVKELGHYS